MVMHCGALMFVFMHITSTTAAQCDKNTCTTKQDVSHTSVVHTVALACALMSDIDTYNAMHIVAAVCQLVPMHVVA